MNAVPTVVCPECEGKAVVVVPCRCRDGDGEFLIDADTLPRTERARRRPWADCEVCQGTGTLTSGCYDCGRTGRLRAQVVYTVANLDTGQVASVNLVPGAVEPVRTPTGRWLLPLGALLVDLAGRAGIAAVTLYEPDVPQRPVQPEVYDIHLPRDWRPDLPTDRRHALEAATIARGAGRAWVVLLGHARAPAPPDPALVLGRLCALADDLHLDLVVDARPNGRRTGLGWQIRLAHPGGPVPATVTQAFDDLFAAIAGTGVEQATVGLDTAAPDIPGYYLNPCYAPGEEDEDDRLAVPDVDLLERRLVRDCEGAAGAQAIWRDRRWWHTTLRADTPDEALLELETGQVSRRGVPVVRRAWEPPSPPHRGEPIPASRCGRCGGTGLGAYRMPCERCRGLGRVHHGAVLTITDLRGRHLHLNWRPDEQGPPAAVVATYAGGVPVVQLAGHYRVGRWASHFGVRPEDLTGLDGEQVIGRNLRDGIVELADSTADPVRAYLLGAVLGRPAGRILVRAQDWAGPSPADLARVALGLGLALDITAVDHRHNVGQPHLVQGVRWTVELVDPDTPIGGHAGAHRHGVAEAVAYCLRYLGGALRSVVPADPDRPVPVPQRPVPPGGGDELADLLDLPDAPGLIGPVRRLAAGYPGQAVTGRLDATGYRTAIGA